MSKVPGNQAIKQDDTLDLAFWEPVTKWLWEPEGVTHPRQK